MLLVFGRPCILVLSSSSKVRKVPWRAQGRKACGITEEKAGHESASSLPVCAGEKSAMTEPTRAPFPSKSDLQVTQLAQPLMPFPKSKVPETAPHLFYVSCGDNTIQCHEPPPTPSLTKWLAVIVCHRLTAMDQKMRHTWALGR